MSELDDFRREMRRHREEFERAARDDRRSFSEARERTLSKQADLPSMPKPPLEPSLEPSSLLSREPNRTAALNLKDAAHDLPKEVQQLGSSWEALEVATIPDEIEQASAASRNGRLAHAERRTALQSQLEAGRSHFEASSDPEDD